MKMIIGLILLIALLTGCDVTAGSFPLSNPTINVKVYSNDPTQQYADVTYSYNQKTPVTQLQMPLPVNIVIANKVASISVKTVSTNPVTTQLFVDGVLSQSNTGTSSDLSLVIYQAK